MEKLGLGCLFGGKPQETSKGPSILDLNYECYLEIFAHLSALEDRLNLGRAHPLFRDVLRDVLRTRYGKINARILKTIPDWEFLLRLCGSEVSRCEVPHGRWDEPFTYPFLDLLGRHCPNLRQAVIIFMHAVTATPPEIPDRGNIMQLLLELPSLIDLTLIDARSAQQEQLRHFTKLETLDLDGVDPNLSNVAFQQMFENKESVVRLLLNFGRDRRRSHQVPQLADKLPSLEHLTLDNFDVNFSDLGDFKALQSLRLIARGVAEVSNDFYRSIARRAGSLQKLQLLSVRVRGDQVHHILSFSRLRALDCDNWPAQSVDQLGQLTELECLVLDCIDSPANASRQLSSLLTSCLKLNHLKLGKRWQMPIADANRFLEKLSAIRKDPNNKLLLTFDFVKTADSQKKLKNILMDLDHLRVSFDGATCHHCQPDTHSKCDTIFD
ncbi:volume-regulated anion channel subunit LRRC8B [Drosophila elegans]|uniref:volume-regulated anion channel subunit LRRC8B n=1 Tax=Drosophila elegans TaxID=30023 RepID=UPI0007E6C240|nr:volume-regulated anion channel subunit LRRC8B [Drosophila elegans]